MPLQINFKYNPLLDSKNLWETTNLFSRKKTSILLNDSFIKRIKKKPWTKINSWFPSYVERVYEKNKKLINAILKNFQTFWDFGSQKILMTINNIFKKEFYTNKLIAYLTLSSRCPYNPRESWFMVSIFSSPIQVLYTYMHELFHLQFYHYYHKLCVKHLGEKKFDDFAEAMTVVADLEFSKIFPYFEEKACYKDVRKKIKVTWEETNNFDRTVKKGLAYFKHANKVV